MRAILNDSGTVQATTSYDAWGVPQSSAIAPFGFTGELQHGSDVWLRARWYRAGRGGFGGRDPFAGNAQQPSSMQYYQYGYANPVSLRDPSGRCVGKTCGPEIAPWLLAEMQDHLAYGKRMQQALRMLFREVHTECWAFSQGRWGNGRTWDDLTLSPFREIVQAMGIGNKVVNPNLNVVSASISAFNIVKSLRIIEFALYGLSVDYANIRLGDLPHTGTPRCQGCPLSKSKPGGIGTDTHYSVTLCGKCIDASDIGNIMFGLGGYARGFDLEFTTETAAGYNLFNDTLKPLMKRQWGAVGNPFNGDPLGATVGWLLAQHIDGSSNIQSFCDKYRSLEFIPYHDLTEQTAPCVACTTETVTPLHVPPSSLKARWSSRDTIGWLKDLGMFPNLGK